MRQAQQPNSAWAQRERWTDLAWIGRHLADLQPVARAAFPEWGRGAVVVDTTTRLAALGYPFAYVGQAAVAQYADLDTEDLLARYDPAEELVVVLLKPERRASAYRMQARLPGQGAS